MDIPDKKNVPQLVYGTPNFALRWLVRLQKVFELTGNPLAAWAAYHTARRFYAPIPEWVFAYFDKSADGILGAKSGRNGAQKIFAALGMTTYGRGGVVKRFALDMLRIHAVECVENVCQESRSMEATYAEVAQFLGIFFGTDVETRTVRRWYEAARQTQTVVVAK